MVAETSSIVYSVLIGVVILFQLALAAGMPWGVAAMGGKFPGTLPPPMRAAAVVQAVVLAGLAALVLSRAGIALPAWRSFAANAIWFVVAFSAVGTVLNTITRSKWERRIWAPVTLLMLIASVLVALGPR